MKFLFKLAIIAIAAKLFISLPRGSSKELDKVGDLTVRDMAEHVAAAFSKVEKTVSGAFADEATEAKGHAGRASVARHQGG